MKFSVIIPVYNSAEFLNKCIDSIVLQGYDDFELILVDDGSTDVSRQICQEYVRKYDNVQLIMQENSGPSAARNHGIHRAAGEYLAFVDSDDWVMPDYFRKLERAVSESPDLVFFGRCHSGKGNIVTSAFPSGVYTSKEQIIDFIARNYSTGDIASCTNKLFSRNLFADEALKFPTGTVVEEDLQFVLSAIDHSETLLSLEDGLYFYHRRKSGSVTTQYNPIKFDCKRKAYAVEQAYAYKWNNSLLEQAFDDNYLTYISASINNLMYQACTLSKKQKLDEIKRFYCASETVTCISRSKGLSLRSKVMYWLIKLKLYELSYLIHYITFHSRRR